MARETEPGAGSRGRQHNGGPEPPAQEDERLLDHHIEEILGTLARRSARETGLDGDTQSVD